MCANLIVMCNLVSVSEHRKLQLILIIFVNFFDNENAKYLCILKEYIIYDRAKTMSICIEWRRARNFRIFNDTKHFRFVNQMVATESIKLTMKAIKDEKMTTIKIKIIHFVVTQHIIKTNIKISCQIYTHSHTHRKRFRAVRHRDRVDRWADIRHTKADCVSIKWDWVFRRMYTLM